MTGSPRPPAPSGAAARPRALSLALARSGAEPWWWSHFDQAALPVDFHYTLVVDPEGRPRSMRSRRFWRMVGGITAALWRSRRDGDAFLTTGECDWTSFVVAGWQTITGMRRPRHIIVQFIMRERTDSLASRLKYAFMRWCFSSVATVVCSARAECDYYAEAFGWQPGKTAFLPFHTDPSFLDVPTREGDYAVAAGRSFRDYDTLLDAWAQVAMPLVIVGYKGARTPPPNVTIHRELPLAELTAVIAGSRIVVVPLEERRISIGQSVILQAMAMGKPVVVTAVDGTVDYLEHMGTGLLVPPRDAAALARAAETLNGDAELRQRLSEAGRRRIRERHMMAHYMEGMSRIMTTGARE